LSRKSADVATSVIIFSVGLGSFPWIRDFNWSLFFIVVLGKGYDGKRMSEILNREGIINGDAQVSA
jgi:hypothetical protein